MVRTAIVGDIHINLPKNQQSVHYRESVNRATALFDILHNKGYDYIIVAGDLFDKARPSLEEIAFVTKLLSVFKNVIIIDGNHENVTKNTCTYDYIHIPNTIHMSYDVMNIEGVSIRFIGHKNIQKHIITSVSDILISHFRCSLGVHIKEEVPLADIAKKFKNVILGDIHDAIQPLPNVMYTSSPYGLHYDSGRSTHGYIELTLDNGSYTINRVKLDLPNKLKMHVTYEELMAMDLSNNVHRLLIEVVGTLEELKQLPINELVTYRPIVKKVKLKEDTRVQIKTDILETLKSYIESDNTDILDTIYKEVV